MVSETYKINGMHCAACTQKVTRVLEQVPGVHRAVVSLEPPEAVVEMRERIPFSTLAQAVASAGSYQLANKSVAVTTSGTDDSATTLPKESLYPLILIVGYLAGTTLLIELASGGVELDRLMRHFMAGFFLVFSFFKLLDLRGFADTYRGYDLLARAIPAWAFVYPIAELALGIAYLIGWRLTLVNALTLGLMVIGAAGVFSALTQKRAIRCACLGTVLNLPMTTVTLVEDLGMAGMAGAMLLWRH